MKGEITMDFKAILLAIWDVLVALMKKVFAIEAGVPEDELE